MGVGGISLPWDEKAMNHELLCCLKLCLDDGFMRAHDWHLVSDEYGKASFCSCSCSVPRNNVPRILNTTSVHPLPCVQLLHCDWLVSEGLSPCVGNSCRQMQLSNSGIRARVRKVKDSSKSIRQRGLERPVLIKFSVIPT